jgi:hypothetical protein
MKDPDINRYLRTMPPAFDAFIRMAKQQQLNRKSSQDENAEKIRFHQTKGTETSLINVSRDEINLDDICTN